MDVHDILLHLLLILLAARMLGGLAVKLQMPAVLGEMLVGILLGPSLLGWISPHETLTLLAEIGVILLLFDVGTDTDFKRLLNVGGRAALTATVGVLAPLLGGFALSHWLFGLPTTTAWYVGGALTATSIGITLRMLADLDRRDSIEARIVLGAAVLDDVLGIVLLAVLFEAVETGHVSLSHSLALLTLVLAFLVFAPMAARLVSLVIERFNAARHRPGLIPISIICLVLFFAWLAHQAGAPELLGGFAAGIALSARFRFPRHLLIPHERLFDRHVHEHMQPIVQLFVPIFFVSVGLSLNLTAVDWSSPFIWLFAPLLLLVAVLGKLLGGLLLLNENSRTRWAVGIAMIPRGEVGLVFAELGRQAGVLNQEIYAALLLVVAVTTLATPFLLRVLYRLTAPVPAVGPPPHRPAPTTARRR